MGSNKRSAQAKRRAEFQAQMLDLGGGLGDVFAREDARRQARAEERESALRNKACESKNRYISRYDAEEAIRMCAEHGTRGLHAYKCEYCKGWHLTSKPRRD